MEDDKGGSCDILVTCKGNYNPLNSSESYCGQDGSIGDATIPSLIRGITVTILSRSREE